MVLSSEAAAAIMSNGELRQIPQEESVRFKVVTDFARIPNFVVPFRLLSQLRPSSQAPTKSSSD